MKAALSGYFVERQELNDALGYVARAEGGADCDRCWGVHFCVCAQSRTDAVTRAHDSSESTDGPQRAPDPPTSRFAVVCFSLCES